MELAKKRLSFGNYSLQYLSECYTKSYDPTLAHTSEYDCILCERLLIQLLENDPKDGLGLKWLLRIYNESKKNKEK